VRRCPLRRSASYARQAGGEGFGQRGSVRRSPGASRQPCSPPGASVGSVSRVRWGPGTVLRPTSDSMIRDLASFTNEFQPYSAWSADTDAGDVQLLARRGPARAAQHMPRNDRQRRCRRCGTNDLTSCDPRRTVCLVILRGRVRRQCTVYFQAVLRRFVLVLPCSGGGNRLNTPTNLPETA